MRTPDQKISRVAQDRLLLSLEEASVCLGISKWTVRNLIANGELPCVRIGRRVLVKREDIERFIENQTHQTERWNP